MTFSEQLKEEAPNTFEHFRSVYLRDNFPHWEEDTSSTRIVWFCELNSKLQILFYIEYLQFIGYNDLSELRVAYILDKQESVLERVMYLFKHMEELNYAQA